MIRPTQAKRVTRDGINEKYDLKPRIKANRYAGLWLLDTKRDKNVINVLKQVLQKDTVEFLFEGPKDTLFGVLQIGKSARRPAAKKKSAKKPGKPKAQPQLQQTPAPSVG